MMNFKERVQRASVTASLLAATMFFTLDSPAWANPDQDCHPGMSMGGHGHGMGMGGGMGYGMHGLQPHNAAEHFLKMSSSLKLSDEQIKQLTKLRDEYIEKNATTEQQLKVAYGDVPRILYADDVDMNAANALFEKIGKMDSQLWHAYAQQLHDIKAMLTSEQKQALSSLWQDRHRSMEGMHGDMPMGHGDMPMHKGM